MSAAAISLPGALKARLAEAVGVLESNPSIGRPAGNARPGLAIGHRHDVRWRFPSLAAFGKEVVVA